MWPELVPGKRYFATSLFAPQVGDFIVFRNPENPLQVIVKKAVKFEKGVYYAEGLLSGSSSYEVPQKYILGKLLGKRS